MEPAEFDPDDIEALRAELAVERTARREAEARASGAEAMVAHLRRVIAKLEHHCYGASSERGRKLLEQAELQLEELEADAAEEAITTEVADQAGSVVRSFTRRKPVRSPLPAHLPRERVVIPGPTACPCCGGALCKLGETITEALESVPRQWKVIQTVRAIGWSNSHLYEIRARDVGWGRPDPYSGDGPLDASKARLIDCWRDVGAGSLKYLYDFGDGWEHSVRIERITNAVPSIAYPPLIEATGRCPPEDVGGSWGYREFLEVIADPNHEEHAERLQWIGGHFDPTNVNVEALAQAVHSLAKK